MNDNKKRTVLDKLVLDLPRRSTTTEAQKDNKKTDLGKLAREYNRRCELEAENEGLCHNPLCENEELPSEMIGHQCDCGGYIWHKDEYREEEDTTCLESNSCAHCDVEMEYLYEHEKRETCRRCENILEQDPSAFQ